jgi:DNA mismatch repair protein MutS
LENNYPRIKNAKVAIREWRDEVIFLHEVKFGTADKSYGIQVAKIAGLPHSVTHRASVILKELESTSTTFNLESMTNTSDSNTKILNSNNEKNQAFRRKVKESLRIFDMLNSINTDDITPKEALNILDATVLSIKSID